MSNPSNKPIDPFAAAKRRAGVHVSLELHDVIALRPKWSDEQARTFLERNAVVIAHTMLIAGTQAIGQLLEANDHDC